MSEVRYMISEAAKQVQVESHVLRYWEEELGLTIGRTEMGHRYYTDDDIQLFCCIQKLKNEGMLLKDLKPLIPELTAARQKLSADKPSSEDASPQTQISNNEAGEKQTAKTLPDPKAASKVSKSDKSTELALSEAEVIPVTQAEQVRTLIGGVLTDVVTANNETLKREISQSVTTNVMREMDYLFQASERREEEHYRKLDHLIRQQQAARRETAKATPLGRLKKILT